MYPSVEAFFAKEFPDLVDGLHGGAGFWQRIKNNTISNNELDQIVSAARAFGRTWNENLFRAALALAYARFMHKLPDPG